MLLGTQDVYEKVFDLIDHCGKEIGTKSVMCPKLSESEWHKIRTIDFATLLMNCIMAARNDLELFPKRYRIEGFRELKEDFSIGTISPEQAKLRLQEIKKEFKIEEQKRK